MALRMITGAIAPESIGPDVMTRLAEMMRRSLRNAGCEVADDALPVQVFPGDYWYPTVELPEGSNFYVMDAGG